MEILKKGKIPEVVLMDIQMPQMDKIEATRQVKSQYPTIKILMLTEMDDEQKLFEALQAGASGYLLKDARPHHLMNAIWDVQSMLEKSTSKELQNRANFKIKKRNLNL